MEDLKQKIVSDGDFAVDFLNFLIKNKIYTIKEMMGVIGVSRQWLGVLRAKKYRFVEEKRVRLVKFLEQEEQENKINLEDLYKAFILLKK